LFVHVSVCLCVFLDVVVYNSCIGVQYRIVRHSLLSFRMCLSPSRLVSFILFPHGTVVLALVDAVAVAAAGTTVAFASVIAFCAQSLGASSTPNK